MKKRNKKAAVIAGVAALVFTIGIVPTFIVISVYGVANALTKRNEVRVWDVEPVQ